MATIHCPSGHPIEVDPVERQVWSNYDRPHFVGTKTRSLEGEQAHPCDECRRWFLRRDDGSVLWHNAASAKIEDDLEEEILNSLTDAEPEVPAMKQPRAHSPKELRAREAVEELVCEESATEDAD